jgi:hypothetical protein
MHATCPTTNSLNWSPCWWRVNCFCWRAEVRNEGDIQHTFSCRAWHPRSSSMFWVNMVIKSGWFCIPQASSTLTSRSRVFLDKVRDARLMKKFPAFYRTGRFIIRFTRTTQRSLFSCTRTDSTVPSFLIQYPYCNGFAQSIARQRLVIHPTIRASYNRTNVIALG